MSSPLEHRRSVPTWYLKRRPHYWPDNEARLLICGAEFFPALLDAISQARHEIWLTTYIFYQDESAQTIAQALVRAARRGVRVRVVVDGFGSMESLATLRRWWADEPVALTVFRPLERWWSWLQPQQLRRMHQKLCAIDGEVGFVGGINVLDDRLDIHHGALEAPRLDYAVELRGPVVEAIAQSARAMWTRAAFGADWRDELPQLLKGRAGLERARRLLSDMRISRHHGSSGADSLESTHRLQARVDEDSQEADGPRSAVSSEADRHLPLSRREKADVAFVWRDNVRHRRSIEGLLLSACGQARERIDIVCPYFYPGLALRRALRQAAQRGVRVRLLLQGRLDLRIAGMAAAVLYRELLNSGVRIFEYTPAFLHAKAVRVDGDWATLGSSNLDPLSLLVNLEANVAIRDPAFATALGDSMESAFTASREITAPPSLTAWGAWVRRYALSALARLYLRAADWGG
ncbi:MAG: cardiolipin synthase ClsB [Burkholderiaceae bacterium]